MDYEKIFQGLKPGLVDVIAIKLCQALAGNGLSFRQAEAVLELAKDHLKDAKI